MRRDRGALLKPELAEEGVVSVDQRLAPHAVQDLLVSERIRLVEHRYLPRKEARRTSIAGEGIDTAMEYHSRVFPRRRDVKQIDEPSRKVPVVAETDVLVVGSGPAGLSAALASAREGVDTMLVERYGCFGGNITQAMVGTIAWYRREKTVDSGGIGDTDIYGAQQHAPLIDVMIPIGS